MKHNKLVASFLSFVALLVFLSMGNGVSAQERPMFSKEEVEATKKAAREAPNEDAAQIARATLDCSGPISRVIDVGDESLRFTSAVFGTNPGGGEGAQFDKTPVLSAKVRLGQGACLNAHVSAIIGSQQTYGVSRMALFQVTLTRLDPEPVIGPQHMVGHYETPFGLSSPAVALEAERDVDMYASNFFQRVGEGKHEVPPGTYRVDVWWAGAPDFGGAIGAGFVLKLYLR